MSSSPALSPTLPVEELRAAAEALFEAPSEQVLAWVEQRYGARAAIASSFASIGCAPCTRAVKPYEDERSGRWWWESAHDRECGLHVRR